MTHFGVQSVFDKEFGWTKFSSSRRFGGSWKGLSVEKPEKFYPVKALYDYNDCIKYIEQKYNIRTRDYAKHEAKKAGLSTKVPYQDFWHWVTDKCDVHNPCRITLTTHHESIKSDYTENTPEFVKTILGYLHAEFGNEDTRELEFWVSW